MTDEMPPTEDATPPIRPAMENGVVADTSETQKGILDAYIRGILTEAARRLERAVEASLTDGREWGVLVFQRMDGLDYTHRVWLHPSVPYGSIHTVQGDALPNMMTLDEFIDQDPVLSEGGARLIE